jgi:serine/threonine protein kinase
MANSEDVAAPQNIVQVSKHVFNFTYFKAEILQKRGYDVQFDGRKLDVFSLGVVLYSLISSTFPFDAKVKTI